MKKGSVLFFVVFLGGVICANLLGIAEGKELGAIHTYFINRYMYTDIQGRELFLYLFYERIPDFFLLLVLSVGIYKTLVIDGYLCYLGFSVGFLAVIFIMNYGVKAILLMLGFFLPQWLFYAPVIAIWKYALRCYKGLENSYRIGERKQNRHMKYMIFFLLAGVLFLLGIFVESYINPVFLRGIIRIVE